MFKRILVSLDGTAQAECAIPVAARLARASGGLVVLVKVIPMYVGVPMYLQGAALEADLSDAERYLGRLAAARELEGVCVETEVVWGPGAPASFILRSARRAHADLILMVSRVYTNPWSWIWGSAAEQVAYTAPVPVLLLGERSPLPIRHAAGFPLQALAALDGSRQAEEALLPTAFLVAALAMPARGTLHLLHVIQQPTRRSGCRRHRLTAEEAGEHAIREAKASLGAAAYRLRGRAPPHLTLDVTWTVARGTKVAEALIKAAETGLDLDALPDRAGYELIALVAHRHARWPHWLKGGILAQVLHATRRSLLVVPGARRA